MEKTVKDYKVIVTRVEDMDDNQKRELIDFVKANHYDLIK